MIIDHAQTFYIPFLPTIPFNIKNFLPGLAFMQQSHDGSVLTSKPANWD